jgi:hypothetical protein
VESIGLAVPDELLLNGNACLASYATTLMDNILELDDECVVERGDDQASDVLNTSSLDVKVGDDGCLIRVVNDREDGRVQGNRDPLLSDHAQGHQ